MIANSLLSILLSNCFLFFWQSKRNFVIIFLGYSLGFACERLFRLAPLWDSSAASSKYLRLNRWRFIAPCLPAFPRSPSPLSASLVCFYSQFPLATCNAIFFTLPSRPRFVCVDSSFSLDNFPRERDSDRDSETEREREALCSLGEGGAACGEGSGICRFSLCRVESRRH